jgi:hypothetical protein
LGLAVAIKPLRIEGRATVVEETRAIRLIGSRQLETWPEKQLRQMGVALHRKGCNFGRRAAVDRADPKFRKVASTGQRAGLGPND